MVTIALLGHSTRMIETPPVTAVEGAAEDPTLLLSTVLAVAIITVAAVVALQALLAALAAVLRPLATLFGMLLAAVLAAVLLIGGALSRPVEADPSPSPSPPPITGEASPGARHR